MYSAAVRDIIVAARTGGSPDPAKNAQLANTLRKYKEMGVPKDNIERALTRANPAKGKAGTMVVYEAMALGSVGVIVECLTDNATRTIGNVKHTLTKHSARMAPVLFMFERKGLVRVSLDSQLEGLEKVTEDLIEAAFDGEAEDFEQEVDEPDADGKPTTISLKFTCPPEALAKVSEAVMSRNVPTLSLQTAELVYRPVEGPAERNEETDAQIADLVEMLEADEDTLRVWTTLDSR